jgi:hypothetical protein
MISKALDVITLLQRQTDHGLNTGIPMNELELINDDLQKLVKSLAKIGGQGSLTIKLNFKADSTQTVECSVSRSLSVPKAKLKSLPLYMATNGNLYDEHPAQVKLDLQSNVENIKDIV